jgi:hypothetical protein
MPSLTLFFPRDFADEAWSGTSYRLEAPGGGHGRAGEWVLGRDPAADLTITLRDVSFRHCAIAYSYAADSWSIQDLGSTNGTRLNEKRLVPKKSAAIAIGDTIRLGGYLLNVVEDDYDTVRNEREATVASTEPLDYRPEPPPPSPPPPPPPPPPTPPAAPAPPARGLADSLYLAVQWMTGASSPWGQAWRVVLVAGAVAGAVVLVDLAQK